MGKQGKILWIACLAFCFALLANGCGNEKTQDPAAKGGFMSITDDLGRTVHLEKPPQKIVALSASFLESLGAVDAKLIGRPSSKTGVPEFAKPLEEVGAVYNINAEKVVALQPDLVIAYQGMHDKLVPVLESNHIPVLVFGFKTYPEFKDKLLLFAQIAGQTEKGDQIAAAMDQKIDNIVRNAPQEHKKIAILHGTAKNVTIELDGSIAGSTAKLLGLQNIASSAHADMGGDTAPFSLETLTEQNPDAIFVVTMGDLEEIKRYMLDDLHANPAWASLAAVREGRIYFLPQELFLLNPGLRYPEAVETMAKLAYPGAFEYAK